MKLTDAKLLERWEEADEEHSRVRQWKRETTSADEKRRLRNRLWEIRKKTNRYRQEAGRRVFEDRWPEMRKSVLGKV